MIQSLYNIALAVALALISSRAWAEDARVLPAGRWRTGFAAGATSDISELFNDQGKAQSVTHPYNIALSAQNILSVDPRVAAGVSALNETGLRYDVSRRGTSSRGITTDDSMPLLGDALSRGFLEVSAVARRKQYALSLQHGITSRLSLGIMVPFIETVVAVSAGLGGANTAADLREAFRSGEGGTAGPELARLEQALEDLSSVDIETLQSLLTEKGYERFSDYRGSGIGDVVLGARYNLLNERTRSGEWIASTQLGATVPTGKLRKPSQLTAVDFGQGAWDIAGAGLLNWSPTSLLSFSTGLHYTYRLPGHRLKRVRADASEVVPDASSEENVWQRLGDKAWLTAGLRLSPSDWMSLDASYEWYRKWADRFRGNRGRDYGFLEDETDVYLETLQLGVTFSTVTPFIQNRFFMPLEFSVNAYSPLEGRNTPIAPYATAELALFF